MSHLAAKPDTQTNAEGTALTNLTALATSAAGEFIRKTGATTFENATPAGGGTGDVTGPASSTDNALARFHLATGKIVQNSAVILGDSGDMSWSVNSDVIALNITNTLATSREYPVMLITNDSSSGVGLRIVHTNASNSQGGIRLDSPSPEIEFVETDQVGTDGTGKFEIRVQNDIFSINGRNSADSSFEQAFTFERLADGGRMATGGENNPAAMIEAVHTGTNPYFYASSSTSADGDVFSVNNNGVLAVGNWTNAAAATGKIQLNSNATSPSSIDLSNTIAVGTGGGGANATNKFLGQFGWTSRDSSFTAPKLVAYIGAEATETYAADTDTGSAIVFYTGTDNNTSPTEKLRISQDGTLIMGTNSLTMTGSIAATGARVTKGWFTDIESTNMPTVGGTAILTSLTAPQFTTIELGHATQNTLSAASGILSIESVAIPTISSTHTITNKRIEPRIVSAASYTTDTGTSLDVSTTDVFVITAQAGALLFNAPSGTPVQGQKLIIRIKDNGTARALTYNAIFRASPDLALPTTTVLSKTLYMGFIYNSTDAKWDLIAVLNNFT